MSGKTRVKDERTAERDELAFRRQLDQLFSLGMSEEHGPRIRGGVNLLLQPEGPETIVHDLAEERRTEMESFYHSIGIEGSVPKPAVSNGEFNRRRKAGQELFWRFATSLVSYEVFMAACGQDGHWTVADEAARAKIGWEVATEGYWFWADVQERCPRLDTSWNELNRTIRLLFLEEDVIVWHERKSKGVVLDVLTRTWLRTRFDHSGALCAGGYDGAVVVCRYCAEFLAKSWGNHGGRVAEVVKELVA